MLIKEGCMAETVPHEWRSLEYLDPAEVLLRLRSLATSGLLDDLPYKVSGLRRRDLRPFLEGRQAALFCFGISRAIGAEVRFALLESADYDIVTRSRQGDTTVYVPVQLKELVPETVNPHAQLQHILDSLDRKLPDSKDLVVAIHINRDVPDLCPAELRLPRNLGQLWLYGAKDRSQNTWYLVGDLLKDPNLVREFIYPRPHGLRWVHKEGGLYQQARRDWVIRALGAARVPMNRIYPATLRVLGRQGLRNCGRVNMLGVECVEENNRGNS